LNILNAFDGATDEIIKPSDIMNRIEGFPETVIVTFGSRMLEKLLDECGGENNAEIVANLQISFTVPVYRIKYKGKELAIYQTAVGGPATVGLLEETAAMGGKKFLIFGSCGSLDKDITDGHIVVPDEAYRDEGTSYHYAPPSPDGYIRVNSAERLFSILTELEVPALRGRTWTTDAFYRETRGNFEKRRNEGCLTVEMECSAAAAFAAFRNVEVYQFLYTADNLGGGEWERRLLGGMTDDHRRTYARIALEAAIRL